MSKCPKGPWHIVEGRVNGSLEIFSGKKAILEVWHQDDVETEQAIARRIVACINACEGFSIEELEGTDMHKDSIEADAEIRELKKQRDELLKALRVALNALEEISIEMTVGDRFTNAGQYMLDALPIASRAIAKAGGAA